MDAVDRDGRKTLSSGREPLIQTVRRLLNALDRKTRRDAGLSIVLALVMAVLEAAGFGLLYPLLQALSAETAVHHGLTGRLYEFFGSPTYNSFLLGLAAAVLVLLLLRSLLGVILLKWQTTIVANSEATMASRLFGIYMSAPYLEHIRRNSAELIRNINASVGEVHAQAVLPALTIFSDLLSVVIVVLVVVVVSPLTAIVAVVYFSAVSFVFARVIARRAQSLGRQSQDFQRAMYKRTQEGLAGHKLFAVFRQSERVAREFSDERRRLARVRARVVFYGQFPQQYLEAAMLVGVMLTAAAAFGTQPRATAVATLGLMIATSFRMLPSLYAVLSGLNRIRLGQAALADVSRDLAEGASPPAELRPPERDEVAAPDFHSTIEFDGVGFDYPVSLSPALARIDCSIGRGESVGLVGPSGAGKTTFLDLLMGVLGPTRGRILIDGQPLDDETRDAWLSHVGYVPQETFLFDGTVRDNIVFGRQVGESGDAALLRAVSLAGVEGFLPGLPHGLDTVVGERGVRLSGGQRQRLGIARALYGSPQVLVFDEATSALDGVTEAAITETLRDLHGTLTVLIVAHRLSTVAHCDRLLLFDDGQLRNTGTFSELQKDDALFADLVAHGSLS